MITCREANIIESDDVGQNFSLPSNSGENHDFIMTRSKTRIRNFLGFWLLGLCNNITYVVMLSAAHDLLKPENYQIQKVPNNSTGPTCNPSSTGIILIFDVIPSLAIKFFAPFLPFFSIKLRVITVIISAVLSLIITAFSPSEYVTYAGVTLTSFASGLGEPTFLAFSSIFRDPNSIAAWASGTGGAGVLGALSYFALKQLGFSTTITLLTFLIFPLITVFSFWMVIVHPPKDQIILKTNLIQDKVSMVDKLIIFKRVLPYIIPFILVYYFEYLSNQGLYEYIYFEGTFLDQDQQYRWYGLCYQIGVLISRSSVSFIKIKALWLLSVFQGLNLILFFLQVILKIFPNIYYITLLILYEGCIGGACYVNTFDQIYSKFDHKSKPFALQLTTVGDGIGISLAGFTSVLLRKYVFDNCGF